jgi:hypothetical protein
MIPQRQPLTNDALVFAPGTLAHLGHLFPHDRPDNLEDEMKTTIFKRALNSVIDVASLSPAPQDEKADLCHFDHQFVTLSHDSFMSVQKYFTDPQSSGQIDASWENDDGSSEKGFLKFSDGTYMEIWDSSKMQRPGFHPDEVGFQDGCRVKNSETIVQIAQRYRVNPFDARPYVMTVGRNGMAGDPQGGMFFIWHVNPELDKAKFGIRQILKNVPPDQDGKPNSKLTSDYTNAGMSVSIQNDIIRAVDCIGVVRVAMANPGYPVGLVAVRFSRHSKDTSNLDIPKVSDKSEQISLQLRPGFGTLIFQPNVYKMTSCRLGGCPTYP